MPTSNSFGATRREWLTGVPAALSAASAAQGRAAGAANRPNIVMIISDQFRYDCIGAMGLNPLNLTPNLDAMASRGTLFRSAISNNPVCAPARASIFTGQYPSRHGVVKNGIAIREDATTLATTLRQSGYTTNYIGKWHLAPPAASKVTSGPVAAKNRGGFLDLWQASNELEWTTHPYEGNLYGNDGEAIPFSGQYRTDFMTSLGQKFLRSAKSPFLLVLSYLEVHHQNDLDSFVPPNEMKTRYSNPFVPADLQGIPGSWPTQLSDYFACVAKMDENIGTIRKTLAETGLDKNTILMFVSDHGCHFKTRNPAYKQTPHESSIHIPLVIEGPGFNRSLQIPELVSQVDLAPSLLESAGVSVPASMQGHSFLPLLDRRTEHWRNEVYFEISGFMNGCCLRTPQYTYAAAVPKRGGAKKAEPADGRYVEYMLYDLYADPYQRLNLAGRVQYEEVAATLRQRLAERIQESGGKPAVIEPCWLPYA